MPQRIRSLLTGAALCALVAVLVPIWAVDRLISSLRTRRVTGSTVDVPRVRATEVDLAALIREGRPVVVEGLDSLLELPTRPDLAGLRELASTTTTAFDVAAYKRHSPYFLYVGDYGAEHDHTDRRTLDEFLDAMFDVPADPELVTYRLFSVADVDGAIGGVIDDISDRIATLADRTPDRAASGIWVGSEGAVTPLHHDAWTGILFQFEGSKRVAMYAPSDRANVYFTSPFAADDRWSTLPGRSADADLSDYPLLARATRHETVLGAGDALFIPPFWSHEMEALEANISIPYRFTTAPLDHLNPGFLRPAMEGFHRRFLASRAA